MVVLLRLTPLFIMLVLAVIVLAVLIGVVIGAKITDKKHGVRKHFWEY